MPRDIVRESRAVEAAFRNGIAAAAAAGDAREWHAARSIFADWLDEAGRGDEAEAVRERLAFGVSAQSLWPTAAECVAAAAAAGAPLSEHQASVLAATLTRPLAILTGTPGTGKTRCLAAVVRALCRKHGGHLVAVAAPTGKAAVRCGEAMLAGGASTHALPTPTTIHRMLGVGRNGHDGGGWAFRHREDAPLPYRFVIVDESSMLDTPLLASLLAACKPGTHLLFVGDTGQLPPVGHGSPLRDLAAAGVPCGELTEIRRNAGLIVEGCAAIRRGQAPRTVLKWDRATAANLVMADCWPKKALETLWDLLWAVAQSDRYDPATDLQVLCATNDGDLGRGNLNREIRHCLQRIASVRSAVKWAADLRAAHPDATYEEWIGISDAAMPTVPNPAETKFRVGDKVICLRNQWAPLADPRDPCDVTEAERESDDRWPHTVQAGGGPVFNQPETTVYVANGDVGRVTRVREKAVEVELSAPRRLVLAPTVGEGSDSWDLAYAITTHKSQGSEWPLIAIIIDPSPAAARVAGREWWYTAISRARDACFLIGRKPVLLRQARAARLPRRKTFLSEMVLGIEPDDPPGADRGA